MSRKLSTLHILIKEQSISKHSIFKWKE